jgi:hypothetical protein
MKKTVSKPNALKVFNDNKAAAYKKAGGAMKDFKKSLKKAQDGMSFNNTYSGPLTKSDSKRLDKEFPSTAASKIPYAQNKPRMGYGDENMYRQKEKSDRSNFENYLRSPAVNANNKMFGTGLMPNTSLLNQEGNERATKNVINRMNNIDWNSEEGKNYKSLYNRQKKGGSVKSKK